MQDSREVHSLMPQTYCYQPCLPLDLKAMRLYTRRYTYDDVGNLMEMKHLTQHGGWTRRYEYATNNNQLRSTSLPSDDPLLPLPTRYEHDTHGNLTLMTHLPTMNWDALDRLHATSRQVVTNGTPEMTYYVYDGSGLRMRKVTERQASTGVAPARKNERLYLGDWEVYRSFQSDGVTVEMERESLSVMEEQRLALIDTKTVDAGGVIASPVPLWRLQLGDHLGSASLEMTGDIAAGVLTYEEYHPFGTSSYRANNSALDVSEKRYRYTGKERDEENGFGYHGARYYAPWLGRWTAADPAGMIDGVNLYAYVKNCPLSYVDPSGRKKKSLTTDERAKKDLEFEKSKPIFSPEETKRRGALSESKGIRVPRFGGSFYAYRKKDGNRVDLMVRVKIHLSGTKEQVKAFRENKELVEKYLSYQDKSLRFSVHVQFEEQNIKDGFNVNIVKNGINNFLIWSMKVLTRDSKSAALLVVPDIKKVAPLKRLYQAAYKAHEIGHMLGLPDEYSYATKLKELNPILAAFATPFVVLGQMFIVGPLMFQQSLAEFFAPNKEDSLMANEHQPFARILRRHVRHILSLYKDQKMISNYVKSIHSIRRDR